MINLVDCWLPYGETEVYVSVELDNLIKILEPETDEQLHQINEEIAKAIDEPTSSITLESLVKPDTRVAIAVEGTMQPQHAVYALQNIVKRLIELIIPSDRITIIIGNGLRQKGNHRLEEKISSASGLSQVRIIQHTRDTSNITELGTTNSGTPIQVHKEYVDSNLRIAIGETKINQYSGFNGAHNAVIPGISGAQTNLENRRKYFKGKIEPGKIELNPIKEEQNEILQKIGIDYTVNIATDYQGKYLGVEIGGFEESWGKAINLLGTSYEAKADQTADITVVSAGGDAFDYDLYGSLMALVNAARITKKNGSIVLLAECGEGLGGEAFTSLARVMEVSEFERRYTFGAEALQLLKKITRNQQVILVSSLPRYLIEPLGMISARTSNEAYKIATDGRRRKKTYVIPFGISTKIIG